MSDPSQPLREFLQQEFSIIFDGDGLLTQAFTRRSHFNEPQRKVTGTSEEMAFLGDAVLQSVVSEILYTSSTRSIGPLTDRRKEFVSNDMIAELVGALRLTRFLNASQGEMNIADSNARIVATTYEALVAAIFLEKGYDEVSRFISQTLVGSRPLTR